MWVVIRQSYGSLISRVWVLKPQFGGSHPVRENHPVCKLRMKWAPGAVGAKPRIVGSDAFEQSRGPLVLQDLPAS